MNESFDKSHKSVNSLMIEGNTSSKNVYESQKHRKWKSKHFFGRSISSYPIFISVQIIFIDTEIKHSMDYIGHG